ncbi:MAG: type II secretion system protein GspM [Patulibacter sp.]
MTDAARNRLLIATAAVVIATLAVWFLVISPKRAQIAAAEGGRASAQQQLAAAQASLAAGESARKALADAQATLVRLGRVVPQTDDTAGLLVQLQTIADRRRVTLDDYRVATGGGSGSGSSASSASGASGASAASSSPSAGNTSAKETDAVAPAYSSSSTQIDGGLARTTLTLALTGTYRSIEKFLREVQRSVVFRDAKLKRGTGRLFVIDSITYAPETSDDGSATKLKASLTGSVYYGPALETPSTSTGSAGTTSAPTGAATHSSTGTAAIGGLR